MSGLQKRRTVQRCKCRYYQPDRSRYASCICTKYAAIFLDCLIRCHGSSAFGRRYRAEKIAGDKGTYNLEIRNNKIQYGDQKNSVEITGKNTKAYISDKLYVLRINREVFTIPKRIMKEGEKSELEKILRENSSGIVHITIERGEKL